MDTTPPALSERNMSPTASPITSPAMLDPCVGGQASMLLRRIRSPERKAFMAAPPSRRRRPRGESTPPTTEECTAPNERCINCHIPGKPAAEARGAHQVPLKEEREEEYEYEYEPDDDDEFVAPPPPDRRPLSRDRSPPRHSERQSVRRFRSPPCSGDVEASPDRSVCLNLLAEEYRLKEKCRAEEEHRQREFQTELERLTRRLDVGIMKNTHPALQRWLATGDNVSSADTGWRQPRVHDGAAAAAAALMAAADDAQWAEANGGNTSAMVEQPRLLWAISRRHSVNDPTQEVSSSPCTSPPCPSAPAPHGPMAETSNEDGGGNWMENAPCGMCVEGSNNLIWHTGRHLTDPVISSQYTDRGWLARVVAPPANGLLPGYRWAHPMLGSCGIACGGAVCTDVHGHDGLHSIDPELEAQTEALRASEAKEASQAATEFAAEVRAELATETQAAAQAAVAEEAAAGAAKEKRVAEVVAGAQDPPGQACTATQQHQEQQGAGQQQQQQQQQQRRWRPQQQPLTAQATQKAKKSGLNITVTSAPQRCLACIGRHRPHTCARKQRRLHHHAARARRAHLQLAKKQQKGMALLVPRGYATCRSS